MAKMVTQRYLPPCGGESDFNILTERRARSEAEGQARLSVRNRKRGALPSPRVEDARVARIKTDHKRVRTGGPAGAGLETASALS